MAESRTCIRPVQRPSRIQHQFPCAGIAFEPATGLEPVTTYLQDIVIPDGDSLLTRRNVPAEQPSGLIVRLTCDTNPLLPGWVVRSSARSGPG